MAMKCDKLNWKKRLR